jgi:hypothetical protein
VDLDLERLAGETDVASRVAVAAAHPEAVRLGRWTCV